MGGIVPPILFFFLSLNSPNAWFIIAVTTFIGWCVAELVENILARPRLENRSPRQAIRDWDSKQK
jgi:hypothetical protein